MGSNAMPFRTEAQKCNHWATRGLLDLGSKFMFILFLGIYIPTLESD